MTPHDAPYDTPYAAKVAREFARQSGYDTRATLNRLEETVRTFGKFSPNDLSTEIGRRRERSREDYLALLIASASSLAAEAWHWARRADQAELAGGAQ